VRVNAPDHCIHCDQEPCVFIQIESGLCENDSIYYDKDAYQQKDPVVYNSARRKCAYQYMAFLLWEGVNYRKPHFTCVEDGIHVLFPPFDDKLMSDKKNYKFCFFTTPVPFSKEICSTANTKKIN
jgi:hypothetical protein